MSNRGEKLFRFGIYAALILGGIVFSYPFVWMLLTSAKVPREFGESEIRLLPSLPVPREVSPYFDPGTFRDPLEIGFTEAEERFWEERGALVDEIALEILERWEPRTVGDEGGAPPLIRDQERFREAMLSGIREYIARRLGESLLQASDEALADYIRSAITPESLEALMEAAYRRFCVGELRLADVERNEAVIPAPDHWSARNGELALRPHRGEPAYEVRYSDERRPILVAFQGSTDLSEPAKLEKIHLKYRGDSSWARLRATVHFRDRQWRADEPLILYERDWIEAEYRFPLRPVDPLERRSYYMLRDAGPSDKPSGLPPDVLRIELELTPTNWLGALWAKATRNYSEAFRQVPFARYIMTSFSLVILNVLLAVFSCTLVAYAFARLHWPGRDLCFAILLGTMMIPAQVTMIPNFLVAKHLGWFNTLLPIWVPSLFGAPFFIFLLRQFLKNIPRDLEEAASIDGCGFLRIYWHVMLPLARPSIATVAIFTFIASWNNFLWPLIYLNDESLFPLALGLYRFNLENSINNGNLGVMMAGSFVMTLPILILFFFAQKYFIQGLSFGGGKE